MVQDVGERCVRNRHAQLPHGGEVRQAAMTGCMVLGEEHFLGGALHSAPLPDVTLQRAQHAVGEASGVVVLELAQQRDGHQPGRGPQQRNDLRVPHVDEGVGPRAPVAPGLLGGQRHRALDATRAALADAGLGRGQGLGVLLADVHIQANLLIGDSGT